MNRIYTKCQGLICDLYIQATSEKRFCLYAHKNYFANLLQVRCPLAPLDTIRMSVFPCKKSFYLCIFEMSSFNFKNTVEMNFVWSDPFSFKFHTFDFKFIDV